MNMLKIGNTPGLPPSWLAGGQMFHPGQIIQGSITKLYPGNKAEIKLGNKRMVAILEVGLKVGGKYHFQVQSTGSVISLKVITEQMKTDRETDLRRLMKKLGMKQTRANVNLLKNLIRLNVPFDVDQFNEASQLLKGEKNNSVVVKVLLEMMLNNQPIKSSVFQALLATHKTTLSEQINSVLIQMEKDNKNPSLTEPSAKKTNHNKQSPRSEAISESDLRQLLTKLGEKPESFKLLIAREILNQIETRNQTIFRTFQVLGKIPLSIDFSEWQKTWISFNQRVLSTSASANSKQIIHVDLPFSIKESELAQTIKKINEDGAGFNKNVSTFMNSWSEDLRFLTFINENMSDKNFLKMKNDLKTYLFPYLSEGQKARLDRIENISEQLKNLNNALQILLKSENLTHLLKLYESSAINERFISIDPKQQFLEHLNLYLTSVGLDYEHQLLNQKSSVNVTQTLKGMLLELSANSLVGLPEAQNKLIHLINGLQLQSVKETDSIIQTNFQIPVERLGLVKDLKLTFEGKKREDGKINPDFCRILFFLELTHLKDTIIDMHIQNRSILMTIFNNSQIMQQAAKKFTKKLKDNFEGLNYQLSRVQFKPLQEKDESLHNNGRNRNTMNQQGVDFRI